MRDVEDRHVGAAAPATLTHDVGGDIEDAHERHGPARHPMRRVHVVALGPQAGEGEAGPATRLVHERHVAHRSEDRVERVLDGEHDAGREEAQ